MRISVRRSVAVVMGLAMVVNAGCYAFVPPPSGVAPKVGQPVRVRLNAEGSANLAQFVGPRVEYAEGTLSEVRQDGSVVVSVSSVRLLDGIDQVWNGQSVITFPASYVVELQVKTLDRGRTRVAGIAAVLGLIAVFAIALGSAGAHTTDSGAGGGQPPP